MNEHREEKPVQADKRRNLRAPLLVRKVRLEEGRKVFFGYGKNLSRGGIYHRYSQPPRTRHQGHGRAAASPAARRRGSLPVRSRLETPLSGGIPP
ncbi:hypothetical protein EDC39_10369 [Geothermobacter ehrlichii]|uniref:PilZ domain-containing protein n=1 Tax=Geothermobacter ehrlichii TaxID=213224 RepID=A0A5D3WMB9_9BACT|nr:hypothetical protein [Geothermobacter ehrlichii]TYO99226.1 hypothetical protein EDC39_10369 [Geothermobacter ehrlichii]